MRRRATIYLLCAIVLALGGLAGCGGGGDDEGDQNGNGVAEEAAPPAEVTELSSQNQFVVAKAREAIGETAETGEVSEETREGVQNLIRLCRRDPFATYGARTMVEVVAEASEDLTEAGPGLSERLRSEWGTGCGSQ